MPCWYYDKKELKKTPSSSDNIDYATEMRYRKEGARFIIDTGSKMDLGYNTTATGVVYFHRFYMFHSFRQFPRYVTACCCLFLAGKVEETPKKCKDIIKSARGLLNDQKYATFGDDPKEEVMTLERILLQTIKFDLQVEHPYSYLLRYAKCLKGDKVKLQKMVQMAWTFVNDSLCTTLALQWEPEIIAVALMYLAGKLSQFEVLDWVGRNSRHLRWWDMFVEDITMELLEDICHQVLDLYSQTAASTAPDSPPLIPRGSDPNAGPVTAAAGNGTKLHSNGPDAMIDPNGSMASDLGVSHTSHAPISAAPIITAAQLSSASKQIASADIQPDHMNHHAAAAAAAYGYAPGLPPPIATGGGGAAVAQGGGGAPTPYASYNAPVGGPPPNSGPGAVVVVMGAGPPHMAGPPPGVHLAGYGLPPPYGAPPSAHYGMPPVVQQQQPPPSAQGPPVVVPQYYTPPPNSGAPPPVVLGVGQTLQQPPPSHRPPYYK